MKEFLSLVRKECRHIFRDKRTILIVMIMPVVQIILFGFAVSTEVTRARVAFCGDMSDTRVREAVERIENNRYLEYAGQLPGPDGIEELFRRNGADAVVCFSRNYVGKTLKGQRHVLAREDDSGKYHRRHREPHSAYQHGRPLGGRNHRHQYAHGKGGHHENRGHQGQERQASVHGHLHHIM